MSEGLAMTIGTEAREALTRTVEDVLDRDSSCGYAHDASRIVDALLAATPDHQAEAPSEVAGGWAQDPDSWYAARPVVDDGAELHRTAEGARHWATIMAGNIVIASGYCWCPNPSEGPHAIGVQNDSQR